VPDHIEPCPIQVDAIGLIIWLWWRSLPPNDFRVRLGGLGDELRVGVKVRVRARPLGLGLGLVSWVVNFFSTSANYL